MKRTLIGMATLACVFMAGDPQKAIAQSCDRGTFTGAFAGELLVPQNWNCREREEFWFTDQGSQVIPYVWFLHLEQAGSEKKFADPANMDRYRYLPQKKTDLNPDSLPIGFTKGNAKANKDFQKISRDWLGITCAACHTGQIQYKGAKYLIDGAPAMGDFETLVHDLVAALKATLKDKDKFARFAAAVIADSRTRNNGGASNETLLRSQLKKMVAIREAWIKRNRGKSKYGHARLDAIGAIFNEVAASGLGIPGNTKPADAPVSYPFIWDTPQHDKVQWNGSVSNAGPGAVARNVGEVLGVFGALTLNTGLLNRTGHETSVNIVSLGKLEGLMRQLRSPLWRDTGLPAIDQALADKGRVVYQHYCIGCHRDIRRDDPDRRIKAIMLPVANPKNPKDPNALGTDITMAANFLRRYAKAGRLTGRFTRYWGILSEFKTFERQDRDHTPTAKILGYAVMGTITRALFERPQETLETLKVGQPPNVVAILDKASRHLRDKVDKTKIREFLKEIGYEFKEKKIVHKIKWKIFRKAKELRQEPKKQACFPAGILPCYKARPLNGIWATAPYLHNGSVRTMRDLLLPAKNREKSFKVGSREFSPVDMGFENEGAFRLDTSLPGNSNAGHDGPIFGNEVLMKDKNKMDALLEYLKTL